MRGVPSLGQANALCLELGAHWRINIGIAAAHGMTRLLGNDRQPSHEGAADTEDVNVHPGISVQKAF